MPRKGQAGGLRHFHGCGVDWLWESQGCDVFIIGEFWGVPSSTYYRIHPFVGQPLQIDRSSFAVIDRACNSILCFKSYLTGRSAPEGLLYY